MPQFRSTAFPKHQKRRDEEQIMTKQTLHLKLPTHKQRRIANEEPLRNDQQLKKATRVVVVGGAGCVCVCVCGGGGGGGGGRGWRGGMVSDGVLKAV